MWEDSCFVYLHWLIYISTASLSKWPLSVVNYENYRGHWGPFLPWQTSLHTQTHTCTNKARQRYFKHTHTTPTAHYTIYSVFTQIPSSQHCPFFQTSWDCRRDGWRDGTEEGRDRSPRNKGEAAICTPIVFPSLWARRERKTTSLPLRPQSLSPSSLPHPPSLKAVWMESHIQFGWMGWDGYG